jgi:2-polyprenyl-6-hydroxyphenyl methylase/3-demethylubiquinone-9 3-methyltransferase
MSSLTGPLRGRSLGGLTFLDVGCGSGLFSLAAHRLGARVRAFDADEASVEAAKAVRERFAGPDAWSVERGSILDAELVRTLGAFDVVYAWGVLHHTGDMWTAIAHAADLVAPGGRLYISIYNDQGSASARWRSVKRRYNRAGAFERRLLIAASRAYFNRDALRRFLGRLRAGFPPLPPPAPRVRGMSKQHDLVDWVGGYPFETARPEQVFDFVRPRGFELRFLKTCGGGIGCNEFVFERTTASTAPSGVHP